MTTRGERRRHQWLRGLRLLAPLLMAGCGGAAGRALTDGPGRDLTIYSSTDPAQFDDVLHAFAVRHPLVRLHYVSLSAGEVYRRTRSEADAHATRADLVVSSAMDLQIKLVNDRYAQPYASPRRADMPSWAVWKNQAFAVAAEPIVIGYNKRLLAPGELPRDHDELASLLHTKADRFRGRVGLYDPALSPTGFLYVTQDLHIDRDNWDLIAAIGLAKPRLFISAARMIDEVSAGRLLVAYNLFGSYALDRARRDPNFGVIFPQDFYLVGSRVALITRDAPHPEAARLFLDFMLSPEGQELLARHNMIPLRMGTPGAGGHPGNARAIHVGPALMADLDRINRKRFFEKWQATIRAGRREDQAAPSITPS